MKKIFSSYFIITLLFAACATGNSSIIEEADLNFSYTDDAYIFFRNMRQAQYRLKTMEKEGLRLYLHDDYTDKQFFKTEMVVNWKANRAFMLIHLPDSIEKYDIKIFNISANDRELKQENLRRQGELLFLTKIYNAVLKGESLEIEYEGKRRPLFTSEDDQESFRISMYDFYRLTGVL